MSKVDQFSLQRSNGDVRLTVFCSVGPFDKGDVQLTFAPKPSNLFHRHSVAPQVMNASQPDSHVLQLNAFLDLVIEENNYAQLR